MALLCPMICYESEDGRSATQKNHDGSLPSQQKQKALICGDSLTVVGVTKTSAKKTLQDVERNLPRPLEQCINWTFRHRRHIFGQPDTGGLNRFSG